MSHLRSRVALSIDVDVGSDVARDVVVGDPWLGYGKSRGLPDDKS